MLALRRGCPIPAASSSFAQEKCGVGVKASAAGHDGSSDLTLALNRRRGRGHCDGHCMHGTLPGHRAESQTHIAVRKQKGGEVRVKGRSRPYSRAKSSLLLATLAARSCLICARAMSPLYIRTASPRPYRTFLWRLIISAASPPHHNPAPTLIHLTLTSLPLCSPHTYALSGAGGFFAIRIRPRAPHSASRAAPRSVASHDTIHQRLAGFAFGLRAIAAPK